MARSQILRHAFERIFPGASDKQYDQAEELVYTTIENLMGHAEVGARFGLQKSAMNMRLYRKSRLIPQPDVKVRGQSLWLGQHVEAFIAENPDSVVHNETEQEAS